MEFINKITGNKVTSDNESVIRLLRNSESYEEVVKPQPQPRKATKSKG